MHFVRVNSFDDWRGKARRLLAEGVPPRDVRWSSEDGQGCLFDDAGESDSLPEQTVFPVSRQFLDLANGVACHCDDRRWPLLYRTLWRLTHGEENLLKIPIDDDVHELLQMQNAVARDMHKMKAFVRFRKVDAVGGQQYVAWHRPDHRIVRAVAPFFARRFKAMNWSILTPHESVHWNQQTLEYGPGSPSSEAPDGDTLEELWLTYYASIFNPARIKVAMMKSEMPVRHWPTLPETRIIPELLEQASDRVDTMIASTEGFDRTAAHYMPSSLSLHSLAQAAACCEACDLHVDASQTVFGKGPRDASMVLVGEQPGDREDIEGEPFVGPAGQLLDKALESAAVLRRDVYVTNVVKHFKFTRQGKHRLHKKPGSREIFACRPWLEAELQVIKPKVIVCLGATAAQAILGRDFRITRQRGEIMASDWCSSTIATWHPAAILRMTDPHRRDAMRRELEADLRIAAKVGT